MTERAAKSILGRSEKALWDAYNAGDRAGFDSLCVAQMTSDKEAGEAEA